MSSMPRRRVAAALVAAIVVASAPASATARTRTDRAQDQRLSKLDRRTRSATKKLATVSQRVTRLRTDLRAASAGLTALQGALPDLLASLSSSSGGFDVPLLGGLEDTAVGLASLQSQVDLATSSEEYGVVQPYLGGQAVAGAALTSSDLPDDGNAATLSGTVVVPVPNGAASVPLTLRAGIRSGERDGTGLDNPAGVAGLAAMTPPVGTAGVVVGGGNTPSAVPLFTKPNAALDGLPVVSIPLAAPLADAPPDPLGLPADRTIDLTDAATLQALGAPAHAYVVSNATGTAGFVTVTFTVRFLDLSTDTAVPDE